MIRSFSPIWILIYCTSDRRAKETIDHLKKLLYAQTSFEFLVGVSKRTREIATKIFQFRPKSLKRLELVKWNFSGCDWEWYISESGKIRTPDW
jgi:hypothetical protein